MNFLEGIGQKVDRVLIIALIIANIIIAVRLYKIPSNKDDGNRDAEWKDFENSVLNEYFRLRVLIYNKLQDLEVQSSDLFKDKIMLMIKEKTGEQVLLSDIEMKAFKSLYKSAFIAATSYEIRGVVFRNGFKPLPTQFDDWDNDTIKHMERDFYESTKLKTVTPITAIFTRLEEDWCLSTITFIEFENKYGEELKSELSKRFVYFFKDIQLQKSDAIHHITAEFSYLGKCTDWKHKIENMWKDRS